MPHVLIVGQKLKALTHYLEANGYTYTFLQDRVKTRFPDKKFKNRVLADFTSKRELLATVDTLPRKIDAAITTYENYVLPTAWITAHLGLPGLPLTAAEACTDKYTMRSLFAAAKEKISPAFTEVNDEEDLLQFAKNHSFPLILKPANLAKSLLVTKSDSLDELLANYRRSVQLLETTYRKYAPNRKPKLILEEFLEGSIHSVDAFVDDEGAPCILTPIVDYQTGYDIGYEDNFHYSRTLPSRLSEGQQTALRHCADIGIRALGMKNSPAHVEIIMTKDGPRIVEIGARTGGYRERMHKLANGIDMTKAILEIALGEQPDVQPRKEEACAVLELFPKTAGRFMRMTNETKVKELSSFVSLAIKVQEGSSIGKASEGYKMAAIVILHHKDVSVLRQDMDFITNHVLIQTD